MMPATTAVVKWRRAGQPGDALTTEIKKRKSPEKSVRGSFDVERCQRDLARKAHHIFWQHGESRVDYRRRFDPLMKTISQPPKGNDHSRSSKIAKWPAFVLSYRTLIEAPDAELRVRLDEIRRDDLEWLTSKFEHA